MKTVSARTLGLVRHRLEIRISDSTTDSSKSSDRFDISETKIRNRETCLEAGFTVSSVVYRGAPMLTIDTSINFLLYLRNRVIDLIA